MTDADKNTYLYKLHFSQFLFQKHGAEALKEIEEYEIGRMKAIWKKKSENTNGSIQALLAELWQKMGDDFEYEILTNRPHELEISCTKCPFHDLAREYNMKEVVYSTFCMSDYGIVEGFNKDIKFTRTKTLVEGFDCCNHKYTL